MREVGLSAERVVGTTFGKGEDSVGHIIASWWGNITDSDETIFFVKCDTRIYVWGVLEGVQDSVCKRTNFCAGYSDHAMSFLVLFAAVEMLVGDFFRSLQRSNTLFFRFVSILENVIGQTWGGDRNTKKITGSLG